MGSIKRCRELLGCFVLICFTLSGCVTSSPEIQSSNSQMKPAAGSARIVVYRSKTVIGLMLQPDIKLNGKKTGRCRHNEVFYIDVPKGEHLISAATEWKTKLELDLNNSDVVFVRCGFRLGLIAGHPTLTVVSAKEGSQQVKGLSFSGQY